jgi:hypothetical protein
VSIAVALIVIHLFLKVIFQYDLYEEIFGKRRKKR